MLEHNNFTSVAQASNWSSLRDWLETHQFEVLIAFVFGIAALVFAFSGLFQTNDYDWVQIHRGPAMALNGENPYPPPSQTFNPPHLTVVGFPWIYGPVQVYVLMFLLSVGFLVIVTRRIVLVAYVLTPAFLIHVLAPGNIGLTIGALGMGTLWAVHQQGHKTIWSALAIAYAYGLLTTKPQLGGIVVLLHFLWLFKYYPMRFIIQTAILSVLLILVVPTLIGLVSGVVFQGEARLIWLDWIDGLTSGNKVESLRDTGGADQVIYNRFGPVGALFMSGVVFGLIANRYRTLRPIAIWQKLSIIDVFQVGFLIPLIWYNFVQPEAVVVALMLTLSPRQAFAYLILIWWLSIWIYPIETQEGIVFIPQQGYYLIPLMLMFAHDSVQIPQKT